MNKKLHLLVAALGLFIGSSINAQEIVVSQTGGVGPLTGPGPNNGTIACQDENTGIISDNSYWRAYTMSSNMDINAVRVGIHSVAGSIPIEATLYKSSGAFPGGTLTQLATATVTLTSADDGSLVDVDFSSPISVVSGDIIVAEVYNDAPQTPAAYGIGVISGSETAPAYLSSDACQVSIPVTINSLDPQANGKIIIDLVEKTLSTEDFFQQHFSMYPNPVTDVLNITSINGLNVNEIRVMDMTGKVIKIQKDASSVNVADLATGTYLIDITTNEGKATSKFIKK